VRLIEAMKLDGHCGMRLALNLFHEHTLHASDH